MSIKFRAWDKKVETMIDVLKLDFLFESEKGVRAEGYCDCNGGLTQDHENHKHEIFPENLVLMQYTEFKDKSGHEIYDGDILLYEKKPSKNYRGKHRELHYWLVLFDKGQWRMKRGDVVQALFDHADKHMVAGNIYENSDLLK